MDNLLPVLKGLSIPFCLISCVLQMEQQILHMVILVLQSLWEFFFKEIQPQELLYVFSDISLFLNWAFWYLAATDYHLQVEFVGGPMCWNTRTFSATAGKKTLVFPCLSISWFWNDVRFSLDITSKEGSLKQTLSTKNFTPLICSNILGGGAFCNGEKIHVSKTDKVSNMLLLLLLLLFF